MLNNKGGTFTKVWECHIFQYSRILLKIFYVNTNITVLTEDEDSYLGVHWVGWPQILMIDSITHRVLGTAGWVFSTFFCSLKQFDGTRSALAKLHWEIRWWWAISQPFLLRIQNSSILLLLQVLCLLLESFPVRQDLVLHQLEHLNFDLVKNLRLRQSCER